MVLTLSAIMVVARDAFHGLPHLALKLLGRREDDTSLGWEEVYGDLLRKIGKYDASSRSPGAKGNIDGPHQQASAADRSGLEEEKESLITADKTENGGFDLEMPQRSISKSYSHSRER